MLLDTNIIIRYTLKDNANTPISEAILENEECEIADIIFGEIYYVLTKVYKQSKQTVLELIKVLINKKNIKTNKKLIAKTIEILENNNIDFADAFLVAKSKIEKKEIATFDKQIIKLTK